MSDIALRPPPPPPAPRVDTKRVDELSAELGEWKIRADHWQRTSAAAEEGNSRLRRELSEARLQAAIGEDVRVRLRAEGRAAALGEVESARTEIWRQGASEAFRRVGERYPGAGVDTAALLESLADTDADAAQPGDDFGEAFSDGA